MEILYLFELFLFGMYVLDEEVISVGYEYEFIEIQLFIFLGLDFIRFMNEFDVLSFVFNVVQNNFEGSIYGEGELFKCDDLF